MLAFLAIALVIGYAALSGRWVGHEPGWHAALPRPPWQPPPWVFGVAWPLNFLALAVAAAAVAASAPTGAATIFLAVLAASIALALGWAYAFYVPHRLGVAAVLLGGAAALTWLLVILAGRELAWAGWLLVPYAAWLTVATSLAVGYWGLDRRAHHSALRESRAG